MSLSMPENKQDSEIAEDFSISTKGNREIFVHGLTFSYRRGILTLITCIVIVWSLDTGRGMDYAEEPAGETPLSANGPEEH